MKKKLIALALVATIVLPLVGCQITAKYLGGTHTLELEPNTKLLNITWKDDTELWYLIRPMRENEEAETYEFLEDSTFGVMEGKVIIKESKK